MRLIFKDTTANEERRCTRSPRGLGWVLTQGQVKWNNTGTGTATITLTDNFTGEQVFSGPISASDGGSSSVIDIPSHYRLAISGVTGSVNIAAGIDGDSGDAGNVV